MCTVTAAAAAELLQLLQCDRIGPERIRSLLFTGLGMPLGPATGLGEVVFQLERGE